MSPELRIGAAGFGLIAVCYGFARFAFGMFLPQIDADLGLGPSLSGVISGGSFLGYCGAILVAAWATERLGARGVAMAAAAVAAVGMAGVALAPSPLWLAAAVMLAGSSTGLASPPMAAAVAAAVRPALQDATNAAISAGTSAGVALSGPIALALAGQWRLAFGVFAAVAALLFVATARALPAGPARAGEGGLPPLSGAAQRLIGASFMMGAASTSLWSFGGQLATMRLGWDGAGLLWSSIGVGGIAGACAGALVARLGLNGAHRICLALLAASVFVVGAGPAHPALAAAGGALFGAAYVTLTGIYLIWGVRAVAGRPATGLMIGFLSIALGQTAGAPLFGVLLDQMGTAAAVKVFAGLALLPGAFSAERAMRVAWHQR
ncbi:MFS transporter [Rubrimonas cliftonensis]|uniref:Predicted arabinose efflux permease, MFS family n=1 Tax=Rubrimonas cliftonensis TaxID=89524 RepID=A0A1H4EJH4_9RHOB|nr:MFS transporter [Rubrimonas cliftonensis]SEA85211.1 Predicted arabinose efflux permease, MFS family [Rubrimonas cliftonensis]